MTSRHVHRYHLTICVAHGSTYHSLRNAGYYARESRGSVQEARRIWRMSYGNIGLCTGPPPSWRTIVTRAPVHEMQMIWRWGLLMSVSAAARHTFRRKGGRIYRTSDVGYKTQD